eukprot:4262940-Ditylum_brightwellii.AAC.1
MQWRVSIAKKDHLEKNVDKVKDMSKEARAVTAVQESPTHVSVMSTSSPPFLSLAAAPGFVNVKPPQPVPPPLLPPCPSILPQDATALAAHHNHNTA